MGIASQRQDKSLETIAQTVEDLINNKLRINTSEWSDKYDQNFLDSKTQFRARHLLMLYFEIEQRFGIAIPEEDIVSGRFCTIRQIASILVRELEAKSV
ncbi:hypothetical protein [Paenibacillus glufosinatiresistens]|uniref:hypothetical protein n=1 Tax=Paenibacillus glufosinatiresistens TaxID=3070657 RepID=UPI00286DA219|nr:hypothetical protein [Paenibacillus sp. YX.27]